MTSSKKRKILAVTFVLAVIATYLYFDLKDFLGFTTLSPSSVEAAWGSKEFSPESFRTGSKEERASQVANLIRSKRYIGKELRTVISELGEHDSYYNSDEIPAYSLPELKGTHWHLLFLPNESGFVEEIIIRKECCYRGVFNLFR